LPAYWFRLFRLDGFAAKLYTHVVVQKKEAAKWRPQVLLLTTGVASLPGGD
jgi:hypothetical protein